MGGWGVGGDRLGRWRDVQRCWQEWGCSPWLAGAGEGLGLPTARISCAVLPPGSEELPGKCLVIKKKKKRKD